MKGRMMYVHACMYGYVWVCMYIQGGERERERERASERERERERVGGRVGGREGERQTGRETEREREREIEGEAITHIDVALGPKHQLHRRQRHPRYEKHGEPNPRTVEAESFMP